MILHWYYLTVVQRSRRKAALRCFDQARRASPGVMDRWGDSSLFARQHRVTRSNQVEGSSLSTDVPTAR